jgi:hypothetical protein
VRARTVVLLTLIGLALIAWPASPASAATPTPAVGAPWPYKDLPRGVTVTPAQALAIATRTHHPTGRAELYFVRRDGTPLWEVMYVGRENMLGEVDVDGRTGRVVNVWTGWHANYRLSRGHFGKFSDSWWIWLGLCLLFLAPFFDFRRPLRMLHFDLLALLSFGISHLFFNQGNYLVAVPLIYPVLGYLIARMLWLGFRPRPGWGPLVPYARTRWLVAGIVLLVGFRVFVNVETAKVLDVGEAGVLGAHAIQQKLPIYVGDYLHRDTYGPMNYLAYLPFVELSPSSVDPGSRPAAHIVPIFFDLLVIVGLFLIGRRMRAGPAGTKLGVALAFAWTAFPYTLFSLAMNTNDAIVSALLVLAFLVLASPPLRGVLVGAAAATKFVPLILAPLFATTTGERGRRTLLVYGGALAATLAALFIPFIPDDGGLQRMWDLTIGFQLHRQSPFSLWTLYPSLHWLKLLVTAFGGLLAVAVAFVPRRRSVAQVAALAAAVLIAAQLPAGHWFYLYVVWFAPFVLIALFAAHFPLDIPRSTQIPSGMRVWSTPSSSPISSGSRRSRRRRATIELPR